MDFSKCVKYCAGNPEIGITWWQKLCVEAKSNGNITERAAFALKVNVEATNLFTLKEDYKEQVAAFCKALTTITAKDTVEHASIAINASQSMICAGPLAGPLASVPCRLVGFESFYLHNSTYGRITPELARRAWDRIQAKGVSEYDSYVNSASVIRGALPQAFWAPYEDICALKRKEVLSLCRLRQFLGLHDGFAVPHFDNFGRALLIHITDYSTREFHVPTGWDGFDNPYFRETLRFDIKDVSTHYGFTLDRAINADGAREFVSRPVPANHTKLLASFQ